MSLLYAIDAHLSHSFVSLVQRRVVSGEVLANTEVQQQRNHEVVDLVVSFKNTYPHTHTQTHTHTHTHTHRGDKTCSDVEQMRDEVKCLIKTFMEKLEKLEGRLFETEVKAEKRVRSEVTEESERNCYRHD